MVERWSAQVMRCDAFVSHSGEWARCAVEESPGTAGWRVTELGTYCPKHVEMGRAFGGDA